MKILVTGGSGFLGTQVCVNLREEFQSVIAVDLAPSPNAQVLNIASQEFLDLVSQEKPTVIVHLAGVQYLKPVPRWKREEFFNQNVLMARTLANVMGTEPSIRQVVFVSTDMVYGKKVESPVSTSSPTLPIGPYGKSKLLSESILKVEAERRKQVLTILRPRLIAGEGRKGTIDSLGFLASKNLPIPLFGSGSNRYQLVAKEDVAQAIVKAIQLRAHGTFNLGSDNPPIIRDLISYVLSASGSRSPMIRVPNKLMTLVLRVLDRIGISPLSPEQFEIAGLDYVLDTRSTKHVLNWQPTQTDKQILLKSFGSRG